MISARFSSNHGGSSMCVPSSDSDLVAGESALSRGRALHQNPAGAAAVNRVEVVAVLDLRAIGVAQLFVDALLFGQLFVALQIHGDVVRRAGAEDPAPRRAVGLVHQSDGLGSAAAGDFEAMQIAVRAGLLESQRVDKEALGFPNFPHREHRSVEAAHGHVAADLIRGPPLALVGIVFDHLDLQSGGMTEAQILLPEAFLDALIGHLVALHVFFPELDGSLGYGVSRGLDLARARAALHAVKREGGIDRAGLAVRIRVIQMIVSVSGRRTVRSA